MTAPSIKLYISCHKPSCVPQSSLFYPVQVGSAQAAQAIPGWIRDDVGENISEKNDAYCELTALYWAWKNDRADYYGFCHYRRYFSFSDQRLPEDDHGSVLCPELSENVLERLGLDDEERIRKKIEPYDLIISQPDRVRRHRWKNLYEQYAASPDLHVEDLRAAVALVEELYPDYAVDAEEYLSGELFYPCNLFIMKRELFEEYLAWLFSILFALETRLDMSDYSVEGRRTMGHIAERLLGIFYTHLKRTRPACKTSVLQRALILDTTPFDLPRPAFAQNNVPVFFACDKHFLPYFSVTLSSLLAHSSLENNYDLLLLHTDIPREKQELLKSAIRDRKHVSLRFVDVGPLMVRRRIAQSRVLEHVNLTTFYRLAVDTLFPAYQKILWLDSDLVIKRDVAELFELDMGDALVAAVRDPDFAGAYCGALPEVRAYAQEDIKLENPLDYFQAGVILFNLDAFRATFAPGELLSAAEERKYLYMDQDLLNIKCAGRVRWLDMRWNVLFDNGGFRVRDVIARAPRELYHTYLESRRAPYIIHFAGDQKPWLDPYGDFAPDFWAAARQSPFYEVILQRMMGGKGAKANARLPLNSRVRKTADRFLPKGSRRREFVKKLLPKRGAYAL